MHLSDSDLLELNEESASHVEQCGECRARAQNLSNVRKNLKDLPQVGANTPSWNKIQQAHQQRQQSQQLTKTRNQLRYRRLEE